MRVHTSFVRSGLIGMGSAIALFAAACSSGVTPIGGDRDKVKPGETGGSGTATDGGTAGKPETGGSGAGGSSSAGGNPSAGGAAGGGSDVCRLPAESGNCDAFFPSYAYDASKGTCVGFTYGGCGGNGNRFSSYAECMGRCDDRCAPQDAESVGSCEPLRGFKWDGQSCVLISGCQCQGADCDALSPTMDACQSAHDVCSTNPTCSDARNATLDFIAQHKDCAKDEDCQVTSGGCTISETSCAGEVYVNDAALGTEFDGLRQTLHDCLGSAVCDGPICALGIAPAACVEGRCAGGKFN